ncbi:tRNA(His) guanylyltransferase Thg1 family protein [Methanobacterium sp.]|uniref:tRNA(His) guanylyltransferase Thg1 family protein n=1 Tax=Methanobacterium sp. TaxID=2164 RepID=UPI003C753351
MRECEIFSNLKVPCGSKIVIRIDGRTFSKLSHDLKFKKPYDDEFRDIMVKTGKDFLKEFSPAFIYTFSDEINILLSEIPFGGRIEKLDSVFASFITGSFTKNLLKPIKKPISFDSRVIPLSEKGMVEYFKERQDEAWRNCINGYAYWTLRTDHTKKETMEVLRKKKSSGLHDVLFERGINLAELPAWQRRGIGIYKKEVTVEGYNPVKDEKVRSIRKKIFVDENLPIFNAEFFREKLIL